MGVFELIQTDPQGRVCETHALPNHLMWRAHARVLRAMFPPQSGTFTFQMGFSGPLQCAAYERPNWVSDPLAFDRRLSLTDVTGDEANEGGAPSSEIRDLFGYERRTITWSVTRDGRGASIDSGWTTWTNRVAWQRHGDWSPDPTPTAWTDCPRSEHQEHGFPWCTPRIHPDWWTNNPYDVNCEDCEPHTPWSLSHYPVDVIFILIQQSGENEELFAAARLRAPTYFRMGATLRCRYRGRFG